MLNFFGEISGKVDDKGRIVLPSQFKKKMDKLGKDYFIGRKDFFHNCITLYTPEAWKRVIDDLSENYDQFDPEQRMMMRLLNKNVFEVNIAENGRMLIPRKFLDMVGIVKQVVLLGQQEQIEIWDMESYEKLDDSNIDFNKIRNNKNNN